MIVVSDTSAVTSLMQIGMADILRHIFQDVFIPPAVRDELSRFHSELPDFLRVSAPAGLVVVEELMADLGRGEAEAIALADEIKADFLLIDEQRGRSVARQRGLRVIGVLGVLLRAKQQHLLESLAETMRRLQETAGFYVSEDVKKAILEAAGEG